ncbi:hypothetical protein [Sphingomicrobium sediminis]|uniref:Uncharacterized protein n=1 Tax=Sphingomicrobium sediminis TaxID=2950949 RepID=A0A9X2ELJ5_9SPHN|nr:hypothetical protein [Sphingomicrobium sediminis]MCM8557579.1 hypothetical protein [Sphingomicrobium sediminis]
MIKRNLTIAIAALAIAGCNSEPETVTAGEIIDPQAEELAKREPMDINDLPVGVGSDTYRCSGSNAVVRVDWVRTGEDLTARVTLQGSTGITLPETSPGVMANEDNTLRGTPGSDSITFNGATCSQ